MKDSLNCGLRDGGVGRAANKRFLSDSACMYDNCIKLYNEMYSEYKSLGYDYIARHVDEYLSMS